MNSLKVFSIFILAINILVCSCENSAESDNGPSISQVSLWPSSLIYTSPGTWDGTHFWAAQYGTLYRVSTSGEIVSSIDAPNDQCWYCEWDGSSLWTHDGSTFFQLTTSGEVINSFATPVSYPQEIVWDGTCLWIYGGAFTGMADWYKVDISGNIVGTLNPEMGTYGAAWARQSLYCIVHSSRSDDGPDSEIFRLNATGQIAESFSFDGYEFWGLASDGENFWTISEYGLDVSIFKISGF